MLLACLERERCSQAPESVGVHVSTPVHTQGGGQPKQMALSYSRGEAQSLQASLFASSLQRGSSLQAAQSGANMFGEKEEGKVLVPGPSAVRGVVHVEGIPTLGCSRYPMLPLTYEDVEV